MIKIYNNKIDVGRPQDEDMSYAQAYPVMKDDHRPKCAIVIGDGFTQGYLRHYDLHREIPCSMWDLVPGSSKIPYLPTANDMFSDDILFTKEKWPKIHAAFESGLTGYDFFEQVSKEKINPQLEAGLWTLSNETIGYELRCYLWHYFRSAHTKLIDLKKNRVDLSFGWYPIFKVLLEKYFCQLISFNYDHVASIAMGESALLYPKQHKQYGLGPMTKFPVEMPYDYYMNYYKLGEMPVVYIHGSWISQIMFPFPTQLKNLPRPWPKEFSYHDNQYIGDGPMLSHISGFFANPWLKSELQFTGNYFSSVASAADLDPTEFPMFPDIVPPGFQGHDKYNPFSRAPETSRRILNDADIVVVCGLSGNGPDTVEVEDLLGNIKKNVHVLHVGLAQDRSTPVAKKLNSMSNVKWYFFDATIDLPKIEDYLNSVYIL